MGWFHFGIFLLFVLSVQADHGRLRKVFKKSHHRPQRPQKEQVPDAECKDCVVAKTHRFVDHPESCQRYIEIYEGNGTSVEVVRDCGNGLFWDNVNLLCNYAHLVYCKKDPCKKEGTTSYDISTLCGCYFLCVNGCSHLTCCPNRLRYDSNTGKCATTDQCYIQVTNPTVCKKQEVPGEPTRYTVKGRTYQCPEYTKFYQSRCTCDIDVNNLPTPSTECLAEVDYQFSGNFKDSSEYRAYAEPQLVELVDGKVVKFKGVGSINIYRFSNMDFGQQLTIDVSFKQSKSAKGVEALVTNSIYTDDVKASVSILVDSHRGDVIFQAYTEEGAVEFHVRFARGKWNKATFVYNGEKVFGIVRNRVWSPSIKSAHLTGNILTRKTGIVLGAGRKMNCFTGYIDEFQVFKCCPNYVKKLLG